MQNLGPLTSSVSLGLVFFNYPSFSYLAVRTRTQNRALKPRPMAAGASDPPSPPPAGEAFKVDRALQALGFEFTRVTAREVAGRLPVTETCCQVRPPAAAKIIFPLFFRW